MQEEWILILQQEVDFGTIQNRKEINLALTKCLDELQAAFGEGTWFEDEAPPVYKVQKGPRSDIWESARRFFTAFSRCQVNTCEKHRNLEACLMLGKHSNNGSGDDSFHLDFLFAFDSERCVWEEVRVYTSIPE